MMVELSSLLFSLSHKFDEIGLYSRGDMPCSWRTERLIEEVFNTEDHSITRPPLCRAIGSRVHYALFYGRIQSWTPVPKVFGFNYLESSFWNLGRSLMWDIRVRLESFQLPRLWDVDQTKSLSLNCSRSFDTFDSGVIQNTPSYLPMYHQMKPPQQTSVAARLHNLICNTLSYKIILIPTLIRAFIH